MYQPHLNMNWNTYPVAPPGPSFYLSPQQAVMPFKMPPHNPYGGGPHLLLSPVRPQGPPMDRMVQYNQTAGQHNIYRTNPHQEYQRDLRQMYFNGPGQRPPPMIIPIQNGGKGTTFLSLSRPLEREAMSGRTPDGHPRSGKEHALNSSPHLFEAQRRILLSNGEQDRTCSPHLLQAQRRVILSNGEQDRTFLPKQSVAVVQEESNGFGLDGSPTLPFRRERKAAPEVASKQESFCPEASSGRKRAASPADPQRNLKRQRDVFLSPEPERSKKHVRPEDISEINLELFRPSGTETPASLSNVREILLDPSPADLEVAEIQKLGSCSEGQKVTDTEEDVRIPKKELTPVINVANCDRLEKEVPSRMGQTMSTENLSAKQMQQDLFKGDTDLGLKLTADIVSIYQECKQTEEVFRQKIKLRDFLYKLLLGLYPRCGLYMVGSSMTGLAAQFSDLDLCLMLTDKEMDQQSEALIHLREVFKCIRQVNFIKDAQLIYAKVPILKFMDKISKVEVDLNINNTVGIRNTQLLNCYSRLDSRVPLLCLLVKLWARSQDINDPFNMTLSSYSLILMVLHFLQCGCDPPVLPCLHDLMPKHFGTMTDVRFISLDVGLPSYTSQNELSPGELFIRFLHYFGFCFDFKSQVMCVRTGGTLPKEVAMKCRSPKNRRAQWNCVGIEEPFDRTNTARSVFDPAAFQRILEAFRNSLQVLRKTRDLASLMSCGEGT